MSDNLRGALNALRHGQQQIDQDGIMVGVSRQALDEVLTALDANGAPNDTAAASARIALEVSFGDGMDAARKALETIPEARAIYNCAVQVIARQIQRGVPSMDVAALLAECAITFREYEHHHLGKLQEGPMRSQRATRNGRLAELCEMALRMMGWVPFNPEDWLRNIPATPEDQAKRIAELLSTMERTGDAE